MNHVLQRKFMLLLLSTALLAAVVIFATVAWFTKMTSVSGLKFDVAQWDFTANQMIDDMVVNVYQYSTMADRVAAPGTAGYIPILLTATESETDIDYYITVNKSSMSQEFQDRIFFYYEDDMKNRHEFVNKGEDLSGTLPRGTTTVIYIYWEWIYELVLEPAGENGAHTAEQLASMAAHDRFDTLVGQNPSLYIPLMNATIQIAGVQVEPVPTQSP